MICDEQQVGVVNRLADGLAPLYVLGACEGFSRCRTCAVFFVLSNVSGLLESSHRYE